jgi:hypothetical protein
MPPDNVYSDVPSTEAWRKQEKEICRDQRKEAAAREPSPMEASLPRAESPIREPSLMREDDPDVVIDSSNWISQWITHAASSDPLTYCEAMSRPDVKQ